MSIEVKDAPDTAQQLRETVHDMRRPVAARLALAAAAPTEAALPAAVSWPGEVTLTSTAGPVWCMLHPLVRRFVSNAPVNSTRAAGPAGEVAVDIRRRKRAVVLTVEDNARGFGRIPSGAGLGLSAVARNVVKHGGRMECGGVHASCRLYRQSIGRDRVWRDGLSSRFKCGVPGPEGCVAIVRQVCSPGRYTGTKLHRASVIQRADPVGRRRVRQMGICQT